MIFINYKIKDIPKLERPRERLKEVGASNLTDKEKELFKELQKISNFEPRKVM